jgi:predicted Zn-dependent protease
LPRILAERERDGAMLNYLPMRRLSRAVFAFALACGPLAGAGYAQTARKAAATPSASAQKSIELAADGRCREALPLLARSLPHLSDKKLQYGAAMAMARCAMSVDRMGDAVQALVLLNREFPDDPQVLYVTTHYYSELASRAARKLVATKPSSAQAMELVAEGLESHKQLAEAIKQYRRILAAYPDTPGIHYRLGRLLLNEPKSPANTAAAQQEFEAELKIDPRSAAAEFMLGDMAWESQNWPEAIRHFSLASKDDAGFAEADLGLGVSLNGAGKYAEAIAPLERYVKDVPDDPAGHYQLAIAYARTGRKQDAQRQMALQQEATRKEQQQGQTAQDPGTPH